MTATQLPTDAPPRRFVLLLLERFSLISLASVIDALRLANRSLGRGAYAWELVGEGGGAAVASCGMRFALDHGLEAGSLRIGPGDVVLAIGGLEVQQAGTPAVLDWLRRVARQGAALGGLCTGSHVLARAGLLDGHRATIHWENQPGFAEEFAAVTLSRSVYVLDGNRMSAAGGTSAVDLMLALIAADHGEEVGAAVAEQLIHPAMRTDRDPQRLSTPTRLGVRHPRLAEAVRIMEAHIEKPLSPARLAEIVGMSTRQLERLALRYLGRPPKRYYMELRLARARNLLLQTEMSVPDVAAACGFASHAHFSKCYRTQHGITPYRERGTRPAPPPEPVALPDPC